MGIARNSALVLGAQVVGIISGIGTSILTARFLGPSGRGVFVLVNVTLTLLGILVGLGLNQSLVFMIGKGRIDRREALGLAVGASVLLGCVGLGVAYLAYWLFHTTLLAGVPFGAFAAGLAALPAAMLADLWMWTRVGENRFVSSTGFQSAFALTTLAVSVVVLWVLRLGVEPLLLGLTLVYYIWAVLLVSVSAARDGMSFGVGRARLVETVSYGLRVYAGSLVNTVYLRLDTFILNALGGTGQVGIYSIAVALNERIWTVDSAVSQAALPRVVSETRDESARLTALTVRSVLLVSSVTALVVGVAAPFIVPLLYGPQFTAAVLPLVVLLPGTVLYAGTRPLASFISGQLGRPGLTSAIAGASAVASVAVYLVLVPRLGALGAALGSTIVYAGLFIAVLAAFGRLSNVGALETVRYRAEDISIFRNVMARAFQALRGIPREDTW
jgi:O-antigen/teichoic acid export membrane protein